MPFLFRKDEALPDAVRRVVAEQAEKAADELAAENNDLLETIHEVRKRCKRVRAVLQLIRPIVAEAASSARKFRKIARRLAPARDATALIECIDALRNHTNNVKVGEALSDVRAQLITRRARILKRKKTRKSIEKAREELDAATNAINACTFDSQTIDATAKGFRSTARRARKCMRKAYDTGEIKHFQEWRKHAKYHAHHLTLLQDVRADINTTRLNRATQLAEILGQLHDLDVLNAALTDKRSLLTDPANLKPLFRLITSRSTELKNQAQPLGQQLLENKKHPPMHQ